jgi:hypothetical protein
VDYVIQKADTSIWRLAKNFGVDPNRWPEFCKANPKLKSDPNAGCLYSIGQRVVVPDSWVASAPPGTGPLPAPPNTAIPQPIGPPVTSPVATATPDVATPGGGLFAGFDKKKAMIGAGIVAALVVGVYALKRKGGARATA